MPYEKVGNNEPVCIADEVPFEIPDSWEWVRFSHISSVITKGTTPRGGNVAYLTEGIGFLRAENVAGLNKIDKTDMKYIDEKTHNGYLKRSILEENDILITIAGTLGRTAIVNSEDLPLNVNQAVSIVRLIDNTLINLNYLIFAINSPLIQQMMTKQKKITAIPNLTLEIIADCFVPIPPLKEQDLIVKEIEKYLPLLSQYEKKETEIIELNLSFPKQLKKSILQEAVQGKLVPQDENDEPASVLLDRIRAEKQHLIKEGKIKKDKHESIIFRRDKSYYEKLNGVERCIDDEIPFEIPDSWEWCRFSQIATFENGDRSSKYPVEADYVADGIPFLGAKDMGEKYISFDEVRFISQQKFDELGNGKLQDGDLICLLRGNVGKTRIFKANNKYNTGFICAQMLIIRCIDLKLLDYVYTVISAPFYNKYIDAKITGTAVRQLPAKEVANLLIPLPPYNEQTKINAELKKVLNIIQTM